MADSPNLPGSHAWPPKSPGEWRDFYGFLRDLVRFVRQTSGNSDSLTSVLDRLEALENEPAVEVGSVIGDMTVDVQGILANGGVVLLRLLNDAIDPGTTYYYGTNADGDKGWHLLGDALLEGTGITLTVDGTTGEITIALADLADAGGGSFLLFTRDAQGRVSGSSAGDATDVPVDDAGWSYINGAEVQAAFDATDGAFASVYAAIAAAADTAEWGSITGTLSAQTDVVAYIDAGDAAVLVSANAYTDAEIAILDAAKLDNPAGTADDTVFARGDGVWVNWINGDFRVGTSAGLFGSGREIVVSAGTSGDVLSHFSMQGSRTAALGTFAVLNFYHQGTRVAAMGAYRDGADDAGALLWTIKPTGGATANAMRLLSDSSLLLSSSTTSNGAGRLQVDGNAVPFTDNTRALGTAAYRWASASVVTMNLSGAEYHTGEQAVSLTANTDNQTVNAATRVLRVGSNGAYNLTGLTGGAAGRRLTLLNVSAFTITLTHDATSTAANRFFCPNNTNVAVRQNGSCDLIYDSTSSRWRVIGA